VHGGHGTTEGCTTNAVVPHAWYTLLPVRRPGWTCGAFLQPLGVASHGHGGRRRRARTSAAWNAASSCECQNMADGRIGGRWGTGWMWGECGIRRLWAMGRALIGRTFAFSFTKGGKSARQISPL
jgi:hypothetical protein